MTDIDVDAVVATAAELAGVADPDPDPFRPNLELLVVSSYRSPAYQQCLWLDEGPKGAKCLGSLCGPRDAVRDRLAAFEEGGVGTLMITPMAFSAEDRIEQLRAIGLWTLSAGITQPNDASNGLHRAMGFVPVGTFSRIGWKAGDWHDVQWWQLDLRPGEPGPPTELAARS